MAKAKGAIDRFGKNNAKCAGGTPTAVIALFLPITLELDRAEIQFRTAPVFGI